MTDDRRPAPAGLRLEDFPDTMTSAEAARASHMHIETIREAIRRGDLDAFMPNGRSPKSPGRGMSYRIEKAELERWLLGRPRPERPA